MKEKAYPSASIRKSKKRRLLIRTCWAVFFLIALAFFFCLPKLVEFFMIKEMKATGLTTPKLTVRSVNLAQLDVQSLTLGPPSSPTLQIPALAVDYSVKDIIKGKMDKVSISGMQMQLDIGPSGIHVKGLDTQTQEKSPPKKEDKEAGEILPFKELEINASLIKLNWQDKTLILPVELTAVRSQDQQPSLANIYNFSGNLYPRGEKISVSGRLDLGKGDGTITIISDKAKLHRYLDDFPILLPFLFESQGSMSSVIHLENWQIQEWQVSLGAETIEITLPRANLACSVDLDFKIGSGFRPHDIKLQVKIKNIDEDDFLTSIPFDVKVTGKDLSNLEFSLTNLHLQNLQGLTIREISGTANLAKMPKEMQVTGNFHLEEVQSLVPRFLPWLKVEGSLAAQGKFMVKTGESNQPAEANSTTWDYDMDISLSGKKTVIEYGDFTVSTGNISLRQHMAGHTDGSSIMTGNLVIPSAKLEAIDKAALNELKRQKKFTAEKKKELTWLSTSIEHLQIPWQFTSGKPAPRLRSIKPLAGRFSFQSFQVAGFQLGQISGTITQEKHRAVFNLKGTALTPVKPIEALVNARFGFEADDEKPLSIALTFPSANLPPGSRLGKLYPALESYSLSGHLSAACDVILEKEQLRTGARIILDGIDIEDPTAGFKCRGMKLNLEMADLQTFRSAVSQRLDFKELEIGGILMNKGHLLFRVEDPEAIFIEGGRISFCSGRLLIYPFRYLLSEEASGSNAKGKDDDLQITLFCDRIDFDEMVNLFMGKDVARGDAELNGILPLTISDGIPIFDDGYLYSTPGVGGKLEFKESASISGGVLIVEEAMKDFNYDWVKVKMNTQDDKLDMIVYVNGTPAEKLPLTYDMKKKDIVYDKKNRRRLELKGLLLELRFTGIDLRSLLKHGIKIFEAKK